VVPCDHIVGVEFTRQDPHHSHVILSDDHGTTWRVGGRTPNGTNESAVALTADGDIYINCRSRQQRQRRGVAWSHDEGESFVDFHWEDLLVEPECQGSLVRLSASGLQGRDRLLFANPASTERCHMMIRASYDGGQTWPVARLLNAGPSAYSDLCILPDGNIGCLYERGESHPYEQLSFARFDTSWLEGVQAAMSK
jgi:sialidase-1